MPINYDRRLENLRQRKFDVGLGESLFEKSASAKKVPTRLKYLLESMGPIERKYNERTLEAAENVRKHLQGMNFHLSHEYKLQGSVTTKTNIKVHSDLDLLLIINRYFYPEVHDPNNVYKETDPDEDIKKLRKEIVRVLKGVYDEVDDAGPKSVSIFNKSLHRKVDIVPSFWYKTQKFQETNDDTQRGVYLYDFPNGKRDPADFPFAAIANINAKGDLTRDGSRRGIRLLKSLKSDSDTEIKKLKSFHLTSVVHSAPDQSLWYSPGADLSIAKSVSHQMGQIIQNPDLRKSIDSPNGREKPLADDAVVPELKILKSDLDEVITDAERELASHMLLREAVANYYQ